MVETKLERFARAKAKDPVQEHLREHKDNWNQRTKKMLDAFKTLKKGVNGYPVPSLGINERSKITDPISQQLVDASHQLNQYFDEAFNELNGIIAEQQQYAQYHEEHRAKSNERKEAFANPDLIKVASGKLSRLWHYTKTPFGFGQKDRWIKKNMLVAAADLEANLKEIETFAVTPWDKTSTPDMVHRTESFLLSFLNHLVVPTVTLLKEQAPEIFEKPKEEGKTKAPRLERSPRLEKQHEPGEMNSADLAVNIFEKYVRQGQLKKITHIKSEIGLTGWYHRAKTISRLFDKEPFAGTTHIYAKDLGNGHVRLTPVTEEEFNIAISQYREEGTVPDLSDEQKQQIKEKTISDWERHVYKSGQSLINMFNELDDRSMFPLDMEKLDKKITKLIDKERVEFIAYIRDEWFDLSHAKLLYNRYQARLETIVNELLSLKMRIKVEKELRNKPIQLKKNAADYDDPITRWFKGKLLSIDSSIEKRFRKTLYESAISVRKTLNIFMDNIENGNDLKAFMINLINVAKEALLLIESVVALGEHYNNEVNIKRHNAKIKNEKLELVLISTSDLNKLLRFKLKLENMIDSVNLSSGPVAVVEEMEDD